MDAEETTECIVEDAQQGKLPAAQQSLGSGVRAELTKQGTQVFALTCIRHCLHRKVKPHGFYLKLPVLVLHFFVWLCTQQ